MCIHSLFVTAWMHYISVTSAPKIIAVNRCGCPKKCPQKWSREDFFCRFVNYYYRLIFAESRGQSLVLPWALHWSCLGGTYSAPKTPAKTSVPKFLLDATLYICFYIIEFAFIWTRMHSSDSLVSRHIFCFDC